jgi:hypothetical protein
MTSLYYKLARKFEISTTFLIYFELNLMHTSATFWFKASKNEKITIFYSYKIQHYVKPVY